MQAKVWGLSSTMDSSSSEHILEDIQREAEELARIIIEVCERVNQAKGAGKEIGEQVNKWLKEAHDISTNVKTYLLIGERAKSTLINRLVSRKRQSKKPENVFKMKALLMNLVTQGKSILCTLFPGDAIGIELVWRDGFVDFKSRRYAFDMIMRGLKDVEIGIIGISGMGGIGKTKLVVEIGKRAKDQMMFDHVVMATVSQNPSIRNIQGTIADMLGLQLNEGAEDDRANELRARLEKESKVLVILDDVWEELNMEGIGLPSNLNHERCKVVLTTRSEKVCEDMCCNLIVPLKVIEEADAWALFSEYAELQGKTHHHSRAKKIVKECSGLPLAIVTVGSCLRDKSLEDYEDAFRRLSNSNFVDVESADKEIYSCLKLSYDYLEDQETKTCFLLCSLYPHDSMINVELLTRSIYGLELFQTLDSVAEVRKKVSASIKKLEKACLLSLVVHDENESHNGVYFLEQHGVKMHDLVRDVALWIMKVNGAPFFVPTSLTKKQKHICEDAAVFYSMELLNLEILILKKPKDQTNFQDTLFSDDDDLSAMESPPQVFDTHLFRDEGSVTNLLGNLHNLRTLGLFLATWEHSKKKDYYESIFHYSDFYNALFREFPNAPLNLPSNRTNSIDLSVIGKFKNLVILQLRGFDDKLPEEIGELGNLQLLDLSQWVLLEAVPSKVLSKLAKLEELYTSYARDSYSDVINLHDLSSLHHLTSFTGKFSGSLSLPSNFRLGKLQNYTIMIYEQSDYPTKAFPTWSKNLRLDVLGGFTMEIFRQLLPGVEYLSIRGSTWQFHNMIPQFSEVGFQDLRELILKDSCIQESGIYTMEQHLPCLENIVPALLPVGPQLERLHIIDFKKLQHVYEVEALALQHTVIHDQSMFPCPKFLMVDGLTKMESIWKWPGLRPLGKQEFSVNDEVELCIFLKCLNSLVHIWICHCYELEQVFHLPQLDNQKYEGQLSNLVLLELENLPRLKYIWRGPEDYYCLRKLERIELTKCKQLKSLFTSTIARSLQNLHHLKIKECEALETIISQDVDLGRHFCTSQTSFLEIETIDIQACDKLKCLLPISLVSHGLPKLETVILKDCADLEQLFGDNGNANWAESGEIMMNNLQNMTLVNLPRLFRFSPINYHVVIPSLSQLKVEKSPVVLPRATSQTEDDKEWDKSNYPMNMLLCNKSEKLQPVGHINDLSPGGMGNYDTKEVFDMNKKVAEQKARTSLSNFVKWRQISSPCLKGVLEGGSEYLGKIRHLVVNDCVGMRKCLFSRTVAQTLECLEIIELLNCKELEYIFEPSDALVGLKTRYSVTCLLKLKKIKIEDCDKLKSIFPLSIAQHLPRLEEVFIKRAPKLEQLFTEDAERFSGQDDSKEIMLPKLKTIQLDAVPCLSHTCPPDYALRGPFAELHVVAIDNCNVEAVFDLGKSLVAQIHEPVLLNIEELCWSCLSYLRCMLRKYPTDHQWINLSLLRVLKVNNCNALNNSLFTSTLARALKFLECIELTNCKKLKNVIEPAVLQDGYESNSSAPCFPRLTNLHIEGCDKIKVIFPLSVAYSIPELRWVYIQGACDLEYIFTEDRKKEDVQGKYVELPELSSMHLAELPSLRKLCPPGYALVCDLSLELQKKGCPVLDIRRDFPYRHIRAPAKSWKVRLLIVLFTIFLYYTYLRQDYLKITQICAALVCVYLALVAQFRC